MTEEYRMKLIAARREKMDRDIAAAEAEASAAAAAAKNSSYPPPSPASPSPHPDIHSPNCELQHSTSRPQPPPSQGSPTGHNPRPMYDVPSPRRELSTMNRACS